jgi:arginyl-tRNA synthetase
VCKSDGGFGYDATDFAAIRYRLVECGFDRAVYVVDARQSLLNLVYGGAKRAGWLAGGTQADSVHVARLVHTTPPTRDKTTAQTIARRRMMDEQQLAFIDGRGKTGSQTNR